MNENFASDSNRDILDLGQQPLEQIMIELGLQNHDLVAASTEQLTHKMVQKGRKGRRLTRNIQEKILRALNKASGRTFLTNQLFNYRGRV